MKFLMGLLIVLLTIGYAVAPAFACDHDCGSCGGGDTDGGDNGDCGDAHEGDDGDDGDDSDSGHGDCDGGVCHI